VKAQAYWIRLALPVVLYLVVESSFPPEGQLTARAGVLAIRGYQLTLSKAFHAAGGRCKFSPSCSQYGREAIGKYGFLTGVAKTGSRLWRCSPWGPAPGSDPP